MCRRQALYFWGLTAKLLMLDRYVNLAFFPTSKWNTSIGKSLKIEKYMIYNKEILWRTNSQKKKEKNPHKLSKYRSNCQNMVQKAWNTWHTSKKRGLRSTFWLPKMLQNLPYLWKKKTHVVFFVFYLEQLWVLPYEYPGLCRRRLGHL